MAYNAVSGTLTAAQNYLPASGSIIANVVSGNLSTSDGASVINVPRLDNAVNNGIVTNVGGDFNALTSETNLTFDGSILTVTGQLTASIGISASYFQGDGSMLTNLPGGGGSGGGIFTEINATKAFTTSSVQIGSNATPDHQLSVAGSSLLSGSVSYKRVTVSDDYTITTSDYYVGVDTAEAAGSVIITMPVANAMQSGQTVIVKDEGGQGITKPITVNTQGGNLIDGQNSVVLGSSFAAVQLYCDGISKYFIY
tara:strand:+ start:466 stop:1227 length:762 start_codon:yes stop_codon:yes gene_type:complete